MDGVSAPGQFALSQPVAKSVADAPPAWPSALLAFAATCITFGIIWDISWHETIGRDTFWTPAHMMIYVGGAVSGCVCGWLAIYYTFIAGPAGVGSSVSVFGARAPLGAWVAMWGALAMLTSAPFDNWWHNAYGLDVKIISPPHSVLGLGMATTSFGALLLVLTRQNRLQDGRGSGLFVYVGGIFLIMASVFVLEFTFPNEQHGAAFYKACCLIIPIRLAMVGRAARISWPATRMTAVYTLFICVVLWIFPLFPAQPKLAPIFNPVTHMVPLPFPLLLILPAIAFDIIMAKMGEVRGWKLAGAAALLGVVFLGILIPVQWYFSEFLLSPYAQNWFFGSDRIWSYNTHLGPWITDYWKRDMGGSVFAIDALGSAWAFAALNCWLGLLAGNWMRKVQR